MIAAALGVSAGAVSQWLKRAREDGVEALRARPVPGAPKRLREAERAQLPALLAQGAEAFGFRGDVWTCRRVARVIKREFGVSYSARQVGRILAALGWTRQKPAARASQRDEARLAHWQSDTWPALQKKPARKAGLSSS